MKIRYSEQSQTIQSNINTDADIPFGVTEADIGVVINILSKSIYETPIKTLVQEYLANARDAHRSMNKDQVPVFVSLPTSASPFIKVRDFGPGISDSLMKSVVVNIGSSTKRSDIQQNGQFGVGIKSGFSYTDSFLIKTFIEGTETQYLARRHAVKNAIPKTVLSLIKKLKTNEQDGTEIQIGVQESDIDQFIDATCLATFFWDVKPTFSTADRKCLPSWYLESAPILVHKNLSIYLANSIPINPICLSIDGIPYSLYNFFNLDKKLDSFILKFSEKLKINFHDRFSNILVIKVKNSDIQVSASRESIPVNNFNKKSLTKIILAALESFDQYFSSCVSDTQLPLSVIYKKVNGITKIYNPEYIQKKKKNNPFNFMGEQLVFSQDGTLSGTLLKELQIQSIERIRLSKKIVVSDHISLNCDHFYYLDEAEEKVQDFKRNAVEHADGEKRKVIGQILLESNYKVSENPALLSLFKELGAKPSSFITKRHRILPVYVAPVGTVTFSVYKKDISNRKSIVRVSREVNLKTLKGLSFVYMSFQDVNNIKDEKEIKRIFNFLNERQLQLCCLSKDVLNQVQGNNSFKEYNSYMRETVIPSLIKNEPQKIYKDVLLHFGKDFSIRNAEDFLKNIECIRSNNLIDDALISDFCNLFNLKIDLDTDDFSFSEWDRQLPKTVFDLIMKESSIFATYSHQIMSTWSQIKEKYPLFCLTISRRKKTKTLAELNYYIKGCNL
jgi:hypothetical protein